MQIPINTAPLKALDVPTRWLLSTALDDAAELRELKRAHPEAFDNLVPPSEHERAGDVYRQIAQAIRG